MNLRDFRKAIDRIYEESDDPLKHSMVIPLNDPCIGGRAYANVSHIFQGLDSEPEKTNINSNEMFKKQEDINFPTQ